MPPTTDTTQVNNVWATQGKSSQQPVFLKMPSGQTCYALKIGMDGMISAGILTEGDDLLKVAGEEHLVKKGGHLKKGGKPDVSVNALSLLKDPAALGRVVMLVDRALPIIVTEPVVLPHFRDVTNAGGTTTQKITLEERDPSAVYTDYIDLQDKMYLFNWAVGGTGDLETFRTESDAAVADLADESGIPDDTEQPGRRKRKRPRKRR